MPQRQRDPKSHLGAFIGRRLQRARVTAGYSSQESLAARLNTDRTVIAKAESGERVPTPDLLAAWCQLTGLDLDLYSDLCDLARIMNGGIPDWFMPYLVAEAEADTLRSWSPLQVPGVLQTEAYARAVLSVEPYTPEQLDELVNARMERQKVLDRAYLTAIIDAGVLQRCLGSPLIMAEQCASLLNAAERPNIVLHVVPEGANVGLWGGFDIAARDGTATVCLTTLQDVTTTAPDLVSKAMQAYERILGSAMPRSDSLDFIRSMEDPWKTQV